MQAKLALLQVTFVKKPVSPWMDGQVQRRAPHKVPEVQRGIVGCLGNGPLLPPNPLRATIQARVALVQMMFEERLAPPCRYRVRLMDHSRREHRHYQLHSHGEIYMIGRLDTCLTSNRGTAGMCGHFFAVQ